MIITQRNLNSMVFDEFFFIEYQRCQERAYRMSCINGIRNILDDNNKNKPIRIKRYVPYSDTLKYLILKKIYFKTADILFKKGTITQEDFKNLSLVIIEKEIESNNKKINKPNSHYNTIKNNIIKELESHFENISPYDFENVLYSFSTLKINLKKYLILRLASLKQTFQKNIPQFEWNGEPILKINIIGLQKKEKLYNIVITYPGYINPKMLHRNIYVATIIQYAKLFLDKELGLFFNKLIVYLPLSLERIEIDYDDIAGVFQESEWFKILKNIVSGCTTKTNDTKYCEFCENNFFCYHRTNTTNKYIKNKIIKNKTIMEMI